MTPEKRPIIIKKIKKAAHGAHGGAWKLAYADFVTAMMAFFLLMWLLGSTTRADLQGIAEYFKNPMKVSMSGGSGAGDAESIIQMGGEDLTRSTGQVKMTNEGRKTITTKAVENDTSRLEALKKKLEAAIAKSPVLRQFRNQLKIDITSEGLRIQIVDEAKRPMFELASARLEPYARDILREIAPIINELPNRISILGHTDARAYAGTGSGYSNWELSADRANAARRELVMGGLNGDKLMRVQGLSSSVLYDDKDAFNPINRRISIIVMNRKAEDALRKNSGASLEVGTGQPLQPQALGVRHASESD
ncbi:flagellar motor protein MotB [Thermithiobacillus plumbiphilus]|uniref:Flagellar motor protein MotB n=1 Tax=Thermithiobacillus plumbiphilus TaxID=1729899 RepID=A0ABU9DAV7_9PROT